ncbi:MAG: hypothetical protein ACREFE_16645 [Limisphaerales bacterium]
MKSHFAILLSLFISSPAWAGDGAGQLANKSIAWNWRVTDGKFQPVRVDDRINGGTLPLAGDCFQLALGDGTVLKSSDFKLEGSPKVEKLKRKPNSPTLAKHFSGWQLVRANEPHTFHLQPFKVLVLESK